MSEKKSKKIVLTGDRPTGPLHLGHYVGSLARRLELQHHPDYAVYIMIADTQALTDNFDNPGKVTANVIEVTKDYLSLGLGPDLGFGVGSGGGGGVESYHPIGCSSGGTKVESVGSGGGTGSTAGVDNNVGSAGHSIAGNYDGATATIHDCTNPAATAPGCALAPTPATIFIQSQIPEIAELTMYFLNLVTLGRLERNPTVKSEIQQKGFGDSLPAGFLCYPVNQAADITAFKGEIVPVGDDQIPMIEQTNEIVRRFNRIYNTDCLVECHAQLSHAPRLVGIDGAAKASKSRGNAINLSSTSEDVARLVMAMFTDPDHLRISDPGRVEGNVVFAYLDAFHPDQEEIAALKAHYRRGGLGDKTIKQLLIATLETFLAPIRDRRHQITDAMVREVLFDGTGRARAKARQTLDEVKDAMGINYFAGG